MIRGQVVRSLAGHDKGKLYVVLKADDNFACLSDGKVHKIANPKKKKLKHIECVEKTVSLDAYNPLYDAHILKELKSLLK